MRLIWIFWYICNYHDFTTPIPSKFCSICRRLTATPMSSFDPPIRPPIWGAMVDLGVENGTNLNLVPRFIFDFYTYYRHILHRLATIHNAADSQTDRQTTDRAMGKGRLWYSIGGPKIKHFNCLSKTVNPCGVDWTVVEKSLSEYDPKWTDFLRFAADGK